MMSKSTAHVIPVAGKRSYPDFNAFFRLYFCSSNSLILLFASS